MPQNKSETLFNSRTNKTYTVLKTANDTDGEYLLMSCIAKTKGRQSRGTVHRHPSQTEIINVRSGSMIAAVNGKKVRYSAGEMLVIRPGEAHRWWNAGNDEPLEVTVEIRPALHITEMYQAFCVFADERKDNSIAGNLLYFALLKRSFGDMFVIAGRFGWVKRSVLSLLSSVVPFANIFFNFIEDDACSGNKQVARE